VLRISLVQQNDDEGLGFEDLDSPTLVISDADGARIQDLLRSSFRLARPVEYDMPAVLDRFWTHLVENAATEQPSKLRNALDAWEHLVNVALALGARKAPLTLARSRMPDLAAFDYWELGRNVVAAANQGNIERVLIFFGRLVNTSIDHNVPPLQYSAGHALFVLYQTAVRQANAVEFAAATLDNVILPLLDHFSARKGVDDHPDLIAFQQDCLKQAMTWMALLIRAAILADKAEHARNFFDRLWQFADRSLHRNLRSGYQNGMSEQKRLAYDIHLAATITIAALCASVAKRRPSLGSPAFSIFNRCKTILQTRHDVLRVWELSGEVHHPASGFVTLLQAWDWADDAPIRTGRGTPTAGMGNEWIEDGFVALMLALPSLPERERPNYFDQPPRLPAMEEETFETRSAKLMERDDLCHGLLNKDKQQTQRAMEEALQALAERRAMWEEENGS
jgi:hypothetical protein